MKQSVKITRVEIETPSDADNDNIEVEVTLASGESYWATFMTIENVRYLFAKNERTGEHADGTYLPMASNMIIVKQLTPEVVHKTIDDLVAEEQFFSSFIKFAPIDPAPDSTPA